MCVNVCASKNLINNRSKSRTLKTVLTFGIKMLSNSTICFYLVWYMIFFTFKYERNCFNHLPVFIIFFFLMQ